MRTLAHISDLHFGTERPLVVDALREDLLALGPDLLVVSGDLTQRARRSEFLAARAFLDSLPFPRLVVPGNHDVPLDNLWMRVVRPYARYREIIADDLRPVHRDAEMIVMGLDTTRPSLWKDGRVSREQIAALSAEFCDAPKDVFRVLVTHHPFLPPTDSPTPSLVGRAGLALEALESCGAELMLAGHLHLGYHGDVRRHHLHLRRSILVAQAGTAVSRRTRGEPNSYNVVRLDWPHIEVEIRESAGGAFVPRVREGFVEKPAPHGVRIAAGP